MPEEIKNQIINEHNYFLWFNFQTTVLKDNNKLIQTILDEEFLLLSKVSIRRAAHAWRVALLASYIAKFHKLDSYQALRVGLLHDLMKEQKPGKNYQLNFVLVWKIFC